MGGCCFTPRKTQFLWWYWLLLFSVVGIPMFLAAVYITRRSGPQGPTRQHALAASSIFWTAVLASIFLSVILVHILASHGDFLYLFFIFAVCMIITTAACKALKKHDRAGRRIAALLGYIFCWYLFYMGPGLLLVGTTAMIFLSVTTTQFAVCMLPAYYWCRFSDSPNRRDAWIFLIMLLGGTSLFWFTSQAGVVVYGYLYAAALGDLPAESSFFAEIVNVLR